MPNQPVRTLVILSREAAKDLLARHAWLAMRTYYVYILSSRSATLYTGVTNDLRRRLFEHRRGSGEGFTSRYGATRLVHFESLTNIRAAIAREKQIKGWSRARKVALIEQRNAGLLDLAQDWFRDERE